MIGAALVTLQIAKKARTKGRNKQMIILYNEPPACLAPQSDEAVETITAANRERLKIHTIYIPEFAATSQAQNFGKALAAANNGRFELHDPSY